MDRPDAPDSPEDVANKLESDFHRAQAEAISAEVYQPLLDEIKRVERMVESLTPEQALVQIAAEISPVKSQHGACGTKGCKHCDR